MKLIDLMDKHAVDFETTLWLGDADAEELFKIKYHTCDSDFDVETESGIQNNVTLEELKDLVFQLQKFIAVCETEAKEV